MLSILEHESFGYVRVKGLIWSSSGIARPRALGATAGKLLSKCVQFQDASRPFLVNCAGVSHVADHALDDLTIPIEKGYTIAMYNTQAIFPDLANSYRSFPKSIDEDSLVVFGKNRPDNNVLKGLINSVPSLEEDFIKSCIKDAFHFNTHREHKRLASTPLISNGVFDFNTIVSNNSRFQWVALLLAERVDQFLETYPKVHNRKGEIRLLAVSLRASPLAVAIGLLTEQKIDLIDHMGPIQKVLEEERVSPSGLDVSYIFVGDFIVGGTELKVAKTFAYLRGSDVVHALAVGCYLEPQDYSTGISIDFLQSIKSSCTDLHLSF